MNQTMPNNFDEDRLTKDFPKHNWLEKKYFMAQPEHTGRSMTLNRAQDTINKSKDGMLEIVSIDHHTDDDKSKMDIGKGITLAFKHNIKEKFTFSSENELIFQSLPVKPAQSFLDAPIYKIVNTCHRDKINQDKSTQVTYSDIYTEPNERDNLKTKYFSNLICILNNKLISINDATLMLNSLKNIPQSCKQIIKIPEKINTHTKKNVQLDSVTDSKYFRGMDINYPIDLTKRNKSEQAIVSYNLSQWNNISNRNQKFNYTNLNNYQICKVPKIRIKAHRTVGSSNTNFTSGNQVRTRTQQNIPADNSLTNRKNNGYNFRNSLPICDSNGFQHTTPSSLFDSTRRVECQYNISNGSYINVDNNMLRAPWLNQRGYNYLNSMSFNTNYAEQRSSNYSDDNNVFGHKYRSVPYSLGSNDSRYQGLPLYPPQYYMPNSYFSYSHNSKNPNIPAHSYTSDKNIGLNKLL